MLNVLIVDDEPFIRQGLNVIIDWEAEGFRIAGEAANGGEALAMLEKQHYDLIIADIRMPVMGGIELLKQTRSHVNLSLALMDCIQTSFRDTTSERPLSLIQPP